MANDKITEKIYSKFVEMLDRMERNPDDVTDADRANLESLYSKLCKALGISEHLQWRVHWRIEKWADTANKLLGLAPDEVLCDSQNIVLDGGANEMLKLITGTGGTAYNSANTYIYVGSDNTPENAAQTGIIATGANAANAPVDSGYPTVSGRTMVFAATFGDNVANFEWREISVVNGTGSSAVSLNRKAGDFGTKATGTWTIQISISLVSTPST